MKSWRLVLVLVLAGTVLYTANLSTMGIVVKHGERIGDLEKRATTAEQKLDEHDKRIAILESTVKVQGEDIARTRRELGATLVELQAAEKKLETLEAHVKEGDDERARLAQEVTTLRRKVEVLEKDLVKRIEVLEKLNEGKLQR